MKNQQVPYEQYIQRGHAILDKSDPDSRDSDVVNQRLDAVNKAWDHLSAQLTERETSLGSMLDVSCQFHDTLQTLNDWLPSIADTVDTLSTLTPAEQKEQLVVSWQL